jgi:sugar (pentulose or hexulose) kinase
MGAVYLGLDLGTRGVRCAAVDDSGRVLTVLEKLLPKPPPLPPGQAEQDPESWWRACCHCLGAVGYALGEREPAALCLVSTSGTIVPVDAQLRPLRRALMYDDGRAYAEAQEVNAAAADFTARLGYAFAPAFALPKILWLVRHEPEVWERTHRLLHAADYLLARLSGEARFSDWSNALKSGYDLLERRWPDFLGKLGIAVDKLPEVVRPGTVVGTVCAQAAKVTNLPSGLPLVAGCTDGTASLLAAGVSAPGEWNSSLGTTLAIRGISTHLVRDRQGRLYCHLHPDGFWLPGGASNTGAGPLAEEFGEEALHTQAAAAVAGAPYEALVYPLGGRGERLPVANPFAERLVVDEPPSAVERLGAWLQGQALVERWCFALCEQLGCPVGDWIAVTGGAARNEAWLQLRADVLGRQLRRPRQPFAAYGAALLAMAGHTATPVSELCRQLVSFAVRIDPRPEHAATYERLLQRLQAECQRRWPGGI